MWRVIFLFVMLIGVSAVSATAHDGRHATGHAMHHGSDHVVEGTTRDGVIDDAPLNREALSSDRSASAVPCPIDTQHSGGCSDCACVGHCCPLFAVTVSPVSAMEIGRAARVLAAVDAVRSITYRPPLPPPRA